MEEVGLVRLSSGWQRRTHLAVENRRSCIPWYRRPSRSDSRRCRRNFGARESPRRLGWHRCWRLRRYWSNRNSRLGLFCSTAVALDSLWNRYRPSKLNPVILNEEARNQGVRELHGRHLECAEARRSSWPQRIWWQRLSWRWVRHRVRRFF